MWELRPYWFVLLMVFILMLVECWFAECMCHDGWLALAGLYLICVCGFRMCWCYERLDDLLDDRQKWWSSLQRVCMGLMSIWLMFIDLCCWWCLSVGSQCILCAMMVGSLWSACIWFVYVAFACAGVKNINLYIHTCMIYIYTHACIYIYMHAYINTLHALIYICG